MDQNQVRNFTEKYLKLGKCQIIESAPTHLITKLSIKTDKELLNRPFYWMYVEKMNLQPNPAKICFIFDKENYPKDLSGEYLFFGSIKFERILTSAQKNGRFTKLYQLTSSWKTKTVKQYKPYLAINFKVTYICDKRKDCLIYLAINLMTGDILEDFYHNIKNLDFDHKIPPNRTIPLPYLSITEAVGELEYFVQEKIQKDDHSWAKEAFEKLQVELQQLDKFYTVNENDKDKEKEKEKEKEKNKQEIILQYYPRVEVLVAQAGLFYLE